MADSFRNCGYCRHWSNLTMVLQRPIGVCDHEGVPNLISIEKNGELNNEKVLFTDRTFGCVFFERNYDNVTTSLEDVEKEAKKTIEEALTKRTAIVWCNNCNSVNSAEDLKCRHCNCQL